MLVSQESLRMAGCYILILSNPLLAVCKVIGLLPRVSCLGVGLPQHQAVSPAADHLAVEELLHSVLPRLPRVCDWPGEGAGLSEGSRA